MHSAGHAAYGGCNLAKIIDVPRMPHMEAFTCILMWTCFCKAVLSLRFVPFFKEVMRDWFAGLFTNQIGSADTQSTATATIEVDV